MRICLCVCDFQPQDWRLLKSLVQGTMGPSHHTQCKICMSSMVGKLTSIPVDPAEL